MLAVDRSGEQIKVLDFDIAAAPARGVHTSAIIGTPEYMAPELGAGRPATPSVDVYSLGVILFECLTGDVPFRGDTEWQVLHKHEHEQPSFPSDLHPRERAVIARCLAKNPDARYQSVAELLADLNAPVSLGDSIVFESRPGPGPAPVDEGPPPLPPEAARTRPLQARPAPAPLGVLGGVVRGVLKVFELLILVVIGPIRLISVALGQGLVFLLRLPFQILGVLLRVLGYLLIIGLLVGLAVVFLTAFWA